MQMFFMGVYLKYLRSSRLNLEKMRDCYIVIHKGMKEGNLFFNNAINNALCLFLYLTLLWLEDKKCIVAKLKILLVTTLDFLCSMITTA